jgi:hypothetical protein
MDDSMEDANMENHTNKDEGDRKPFIKPELRQERDLVGGTAGRYHSLGVS